MWSTDAFPWAAVSQDVSDIVPIAYSLFYRLIAAGLEEEDRQALQTAVGLLWICKGMAGMKGVFDFGHASAGTVTDAIPVEKVSITGIKI